MDTNSENKKSQEKSKPDLRKGALRENPVHEKMAAPPEIQGRKLTDKKPGREVVKEQTLPWELAGVPKATKGRIVNFYCQPNDPVFNCFNGQNEMIDCTELTGIVIGVPGGPKGLVHINVQVPRSQTPVRTIFSVPHISTFDAKEGRTAAAWDWPKRDA